MRYQPVPPTTHPVASSPALRATLNGPISVGTFACTQTVPFPMASESGVRSSRLQSWGRSSFATWNHQIRQLRRHRCLRDGTANPHRKAGRDHDQSRVKMQAPSSRVILCFHLQPAPPAGAWLLQTQSVRSMPRDDSAYESSSYFSFSMDPQGSYLIRGACQPDKRLPRKTCHYTLFADFFFRRGCRKIDDLCCAMNQP